MSKPTKIVLFHKDAKVPVYGTDLSAGCDIFSIERTVILPDEVVGVIRRSDMDGFIVTKHVPFNSPEAESLEVIRRPASIRTGLGIQLDVDEEFEIRGRSGLAFNSNILCVNGTIDADYTGEIMVRLYNLGREPFVVEKGMRVAQGVIKKVRHNKMIVVDRLDNTSRGANGFSSTGFF